MSFTFSAEFPVPCTGLAGGLVSTEAATGPKLEPSGLTPGHTVQGSPFTWNRVVTLASASLSLPRLLFLPGIPSVDISYLCSWNVFSPSLPIIFW